MSDWAARFPEARRQVRAEPPPEEITRGLHYVNSDEKRHDLFRERIADRGGLFVGVGLHQNYLLAGWAKSDAMVVVDFDMLIIQLHRVFEIVLERCATPESFVDAWNESNKETVLEWIDQGGDGPKRRRGLRTVFLNNRRPIRSGLRQTLERMSDLGVATYLTDPAQYAAVKRLADEDRVLYVRADFTGSTTLRDIAAMTRDLGTTVRVLYLSNIEQYFSWSAGSYRTNMLALPFDDDTVVLRAYPRGGRNAADHVYHYYAQSGLGFHEWLRHQPYRSVHSLIRNSPMSDIQGFYDVTIGPDDARPPRKKKAAKRARTLDG